MMKFFCYLTGADHRMVRNDTPASRRKIRLLGSVLMVPVLMWLINGFLLVTYVMESPVFIGIVTGFTMAFLVFIIDRAIIMSNGGRSIVYFRLCIGFIIALLGSVCLDEVIFKNDIDHQVSSNMISLLKDDESRIDEKHKDKLVRINAQIDEKRNTWTEALREVADEADGTGGSGRRGVDVITKTKQDIANDLKVDYDKAQQVLINLNEEIDNEKKASSAKINESFNEHGFLTRIKAMFDLVVKDPWMLGVYILITLLLFSFEFMVIIFKMSERETNYERKVKAIEQVGEKRLQLITGKDIKYYDPGRSQPSYKKAYDKLNKPAPGVFLS